MRVVELNRYPVKSMQGNSCISAAVETDGLQGDRIWGVRDIATGKILTARREPRLLLAAVTLTGTNEPEIDLPTGALCVGAGPATDDTLSEWLGKPVRLARATGSPAATAEYFADATDDSSEAIEWTMPQNRFVDAAPLLILTTASLRTAAALYGDGDWKLRRFRPNVVVDAPGDGWLEDEWCDGRTIVVGDAEFVALQPCARCTMVTRPQPEIDEDSNHVHAARWSRGHSRRSTRTATSFEPWPDTTAATSGCGQLSPRPGPCASTTRSPLPVGASGRRPAAGRVRVGR